MIYLFYSDLHVRPERMEDCEIVLETVGAVAETLQKKYGEVLIVNGGDTFNTRGLIKTSCFDRLYHHYSRWAKKGLKQVIIVGNHDQEDKNGDIHPMRVFENFDGWHVVDKPTLIGDMAFMPYMPKAGIQPAIQKMLKAGAKDATVHWGIQGALMNEGHADSEGVPAEWLSAFRQVFSGHYHYRNAFDNIQYIGSPMQQNFGELNQQKGVIIYDNSKKSNKINFNEIKGTSRHYEIEVSQDSGEKSGRKESLKGCSEGESIEEKDFIKVKVKGDSEFCSQIAKSSYNDKYRCSVKLEREVNDKHVSRLNINSGDVLSPSQIMSKYVDFIDTSLDKSKLLKIGKGLL
jgi:DNA repair exonuclease SbcCD nuclease subunit